MTDACFGFDCRPDSGWLRTRSGVARRRLGITSEIERNPEEQCRNTDVDWVNVNFDELFPNVMAPTDNLA